MANPFASQTSSIDQLLPFMMMSMTQKPPEPVMAPKPPQGTPSTNKPQNVGSFAGVPGTPPAPQQLANKTLLGQ